MSRTFGVVLRTEGQGKDIAKSQLLKLGSKDEIVIEHEKEVL